MVLRLLDFGAFQISGLERCLPVNTNTEKCYKKLNSKILCSWAVERRDILSALKHIITVNPRTVHTAGTLCAPFPSSLSPLSLLSCNPEHQGPSCPHRGKQQMSLIRVCSGVSAEPTDDAELSVFTGNQNSPPRMPGRALSFSVLLSYQL